MTDKQEETEIKVKMEMKNTGDLLVGVDLATTPVPSKGDCRGGGGGGERLERAFCRERRWVPLQLRAPQILVERSGSGGELGCQSLTLALVSFCFPVQLHKCH
ncbi:hypothetical protein ACFX10_034133 [Malus domestica]